MDLILWSTMTSKYHCVCVFILLIYTFIFLWLIVVHFLCQRISRNTEELRNGAEDFASLANELVKQMEGRKWWQI